MQNSNMLVADGVGAAICFGILLLVLAFIACVRFLNGHAKNVSQDKVVNLDGFKRLSRVQKALLAQP